MAGELHCAPILIGLGMEQMSMNAGSIPWVKHLIRELKLSDCQSLATSALSCTSPAQVHALVNTFLRDTIPDEYALWQAAQSNID
jgi:phosphoenolpyruvate-protein kinase (PTS system EI component)